MKTTSQAFDLDDLQVASPCSASWDGMVGKGRVRLCTLCQHNVYDLADMTRLEAEEFVRDRTGRTCVRFYRRHDGTLLTSDCPRALAAVRKRVAAAAAAVLGVLSVLGIGTAVANVAASGNASGAIWDVQPFRMLRKWFAPPPPQVVMGAICPAPSPPSPPVPVVGDSDDADR